MWIALDDNRLADDDAALLAYTRERIAYYKELQQDPNAAKYFEAAKEMTDEGVLEFDDDAVVSVSDAGAYVMSWTWVSDEEAGIEEEAEGDELCDFCHRSGLADVTVRDGKTICAECADEAAEL